MTELSIIAPAEIERESFRIITEELGDRAIDPAIAPILTDIFCASEVIEKSQSSITTFCTLPRLTTSPNSPRYTSSSSERPE